MGPLTRTGPSALPGWERLPFGDVAEERWTRALRATTAPSPRGRPCPVDPGRVGSAPSVHRRPAPGPPGPRPSTDRVLVHSRLPDTPHLSHQSPVKERGRASILGPDPSGNGGGGAGPPRRGWRPVGARPCARTGVMNPTPRRRRTPRFPGPRVAPGLHSHPRGASSVHLHPPPDAPPDASGAPPPFPLASGPQGTRHAAPVGPCGPTRPRDGQWAENRPDVGWFRGSEGSKGDPIGRRGLGGESRGPRKGGAVATDDRNQRKKGPSSRDWEGEREKEGEGGRWFPRTRGRWNVVTRPLSAVCLVPLFEGGGEFLSVQVALPLPRTPTQLLDGIRTGRKRVSGRS